MSSSLRILAVCTHNRTRSVMMQALLDEHVRGHGIAANVRSAGFADSGELPTDSTVRYLANRGIDVTDHRSHWMSDTSIAGADLIVTAERMHVITIGGRYAPAMKYTFTLPELVALANQAGRRRGQPLPKWLEAVSADRPTALDYLDAEIAEINDPTGRSPATWAECFAQVDDLTSRLATLLS